MAQITVDRCIWTCFYAKHLIHPIFHYCIAVHVRYHTHKKIDCFQRAKCYHILFSIQLNKNIN